MTTSVAAATTITPGTTEPGKLTNISLPIVAGMIIILVIHSKVAYFQVHFLTISDPVAETSTSVAQKTSTPLVYGSGNIIIAYYK